MGSRAGVLCLYHWQLQADLSWERHNHEASDREPHRQSDQQPSTFETPASLERNPEKTGEEHTDRDVQQADAAPCYRLRLIGPMQGGQHDSASANGDPTAGERKQQGEPSLVGRFAGSRHQGLQRK